MTFSLRRGYSAWSLAFTISIPAIYALVLILFADRAGAHDHDQFLVFHELQYWNASLFGLAKQWSPVMCSGLSLAGEPQVPFASLTMLVAYALGPLQGIGVGTALYLLMGWVGAYLYSGQWFGDRGARALAGSLFIGNGFFICRMSRGHLDFVPFLALPLALWAIHRAALSDLPLTRARMVWVTLLLGCLFAIVIDGSPVAIIHWCFWVGLYSVTLSFSSRSTLPIVAFIGACAVAGLLDAGYVWPMVSAQVNFPRLTPDSFTGPWSLPWFRLIPMRGKLLPANGTGIELSVFIGPVLFYLIWHYRRALREELPREMKVPLLVVSLASIWLGMGSLRVAHVPVELSPFDWLRPLPGFRSMNVTGRYWGFLALPLSLLAAAALRRYIHETGHGRRRTILIGSALVIQLTFQAESLVVGRLPSRPYEQPSLDGLFDGKLETIRALRIVDSDEEPHEQGEFISPTQAVVNCYDMDDFTRADVQPGTHLVKTAQLVTPGGTFDVPLDAGFLTWNHIRILPSAAALPMDEMSHPVSMLHIELNQAFHTQWKSSDCVMKRGDKGNLVADCPIDRVQAEALDLTFFDPVSALGTQVSLRTAAALGFAIPLLGLVSFVRKRRVLVPAQSLE